MAATEPPTFFYIVSRSRWRDTGDLTAEAVSRRPASRATAAGAPSGLSSQFLRRQHVPSRGEPEFRPRGNRWNPPTSMGTCRQTASGALSEAQI